MKKGRDRLSLGIGLICLLFTALTAAAAGAPPAPNELYPLQDQDLWGFIDSSGKVVIDFKFDFSEAFGDGLAAVMVGQKFGYIDKSGAFAVKPKFDDAWSPTGGRGLVKIKEKFGFIDLEGRLVVKPKYIDANFFSEGLAAVNDKGKWGYIDTKGKLVITPAYRSAGSFVEGLAAVRWGLKYGYIDNSGKVIIQPQFDKALSFHEGLAAVLVGEKFGYIDKSGRMVIEAQFDEAMSFSEGLAIVNLGGSRKQSNVASGGKWGFIDRSGKFLIEARFDWAESFADGMAVVNLGGKLTRNGVTGGKWGYIDKTGRTIINIHLDDAYDFRKGLALVRMKDRWGYINPSGRYVYEAEWVTRQEKIDFNTVNSGFNEKKPWRSEQGELSCESGETFISNRFVKKIFSECQLSVRVKLTKETSGLGYGLVFRVLDEKNFCAFLINNEGNCRLSRMIDGTPQTLMETKLAGFKAADFNLLRVVCQGGQFKCIVNGKVVIEYEYSDAQFAAGYFEAGVGANHGLECRFDDFEFLELK
jgi:hypothetical protein